MSNNPTLSDRNATLLQAEKPSSSEFLDAIAATEASREGLVIERDAARAVSLDPVAPEDAVTTARLSEIDLSFKVERLDNALAALRTRLAEAKSREAAEALGARRDEVVARRDQAVASLRRYAKHAQALAAIMAEVAASTSEVEAFNRNERGDSEWVDVPEVKARAGMEGNSIHRLLTATRLAPLDYEQHRQDRMLWPPPPPQVILNFPTPPIAMSERVEIDEAEPTPRRAEGSR
jgi:hypothetical protein